MTLATITFQNYFRMYTKLSGMTGTAKTEETEFKGIYGLDVVVVPPNLPSRRVDETDKVFASIEAKLRAVVAEIEECWTRGQPVLVGTTSVEKSEELSKMLRKKKIPHNVLNAKNHEKEADIVAQAGRFGAVTIATNMAGRGTDILLGGNAEYLAKSKMKKDGVPDEIIEIASSHMNVEPSDMFPVPSAEREANGEEVLAARETYNALYREFKQQTEKEKKDVEEVGGLRIVGTERHESRRIDNQLRGRAGRQGDIGSSVFFLSVDDEMIRLFGGEKIKGIAQYIAGEGDEPIVSRMLSSAIESAQKRLEGINYSKRLNVLEYDNVMNTQRKIIYEQRDKVLRGESVHEQIVKMMEDQCKKTVAEHTNPKVDWKDWDIAGLNQAIARDLAIVPKGSAYFSESVLSALTVEELAAKLTDNVLSRYEQVEGMAEEANFNLAEFERNLFLRVIDNQWTAHIDDMDELRRNVSLYAYGQQDPVAVYKKEGFGMFNDMIGRIQERIVGNLTHISEIKPNEKVAGRKQVGEEVSATTEEGKTFTRTRETIVKGNIPSRNDPCPCGACWPDGRRKKYKECCGKDK